MIGTRIKEIRLEKGIKQVELAKRVHISQAMLCQIERGSKVPTILLAKEIADVLEVSINQLVE